MASISRVLKASGDNVTLSLVSLGIRSNGTLGYLSLVRFGLVSIIIASKYYFVGWIDI